MGRSVADRIDLLSRREYAENLRRFACGKLSVERYEEATDRLRRLDDGVFEIHSRLVWLCYCDLRTKNLNGRWRLGSEARRLFARAVLFLHTDLPPSPPPPVRVRFADRWRQIPGAFGSMPTRTTALDVWRQNWPFRSCEDEAVARSKRVFLVGPE